MSDAPPPTPPTDGPGAPPPGGAPTPPPPPSAGATPPPAGATPPPAPGYAAPPPAGAYQQSQPMSASDEKLWATLIHIGGIFFGFIPALIGYLVLRDRGPFVRQHTATALNFQLTMLIASVVAGLLWLVVIGIFLTIAIAVVVVVFSIIAAVKANQGQPYTYPLSITFVR